ncbi:MAG: 50S ribosomal protein L9 [Specibacter sp.]
MDRGKLPATALFSPSAARDVFEMKGRYTHNLILPRGFALTWSKRGEKQVAAIEADRAAREQASELAAKPVTLTVKVGESGRLYGTVKAGDVAKAVAAAGLGTIDKRKIELPAHIKSVGKYTANVHVYGDVTAVVTLNVVAGHPTTGHGAG